VQILFLLNLVFIRKLGRLKVCREPLIIVKGIHMLSLVIGSMLLVCDSLTLNLRCVVFSRLEERLLFIHVHHVKRFINAGELINIIHFIYIAIGNLESLKRMILLLSPPLVVNLGAARIFFLTRIHSIDLVEERQMRRLITLLVLLRNN
jgi:hypothetical protein